MQKLLKTLSLLIPVVLALHYYLSYQILYKLLDQYNLTKSGIISFEDILFYFGEINQQLLILGFAGGIFIVFYRLTVNEKTYKGRDKSFQENSNEILKSSLEKYHSLKEWQKNCVHAGIYVTVVILFIFILNFIKDYSKYPNHVKILYVLLFIFPLCYNFFPKKRKVIAGLALALILVFCNVFINDELKSSSMMPPKTFDKLSFNYKSDFKKSRIQTSRDSLWCILQSNKYILLQDKKTESIHFYKRENISNLIYKKEDF